MAGATQTMRVAFERENCMALSITERGALWTLTAMADCGYFGGRDGSMRITPDALYEMLEGEQKSKDVLDGLQKKGRLKVELNGVCEIRMGMWNDRWARERAEKRGERS